MTNAFAADLLATATAECANRTEWVAFWINPAHITHFVGSQLDEDLLFSAQHDFYDAEMLADDVVHLTRIESQDEAGLAEWVAVSEAQDGWNSCEGKYEVGAVEFAQRDLGFIAALREFRAHEAAQAAWSVAPTGHLTHTPFAALAAI